MVRKKGQLKRSNIFRNFIVAFSISMFILLIKSSDLYKGVFKSFSLEYFLGTHLDHINS